MKFRNLVLTSLLLAFAVACSPPEGDFCLSASPIPVKEGMVDYLVQNDETLARSILGHNEYGKKVCGW